MEQFQWIVKGPGKEARPISIFYNPTSSNSNQRLSVFGGGFPSDTVTNIVESVAASQAAQAAASGEGHSNQPSAASSHRLSQLFAGGNSSIMGTSPTHAPSQSSNPPNPITFYNSRYKKFEFSQALRQRSTICAEQIQKEIENTPSSKPSSRRTSVSGNRNSTGDGAAHQWTAGGDSTTKRDSSDVIMAGLEHNEPLEARDPSKKRHSSQSIDLTEQGAEGSKSARLSTSTSSSSPPNTTQTSIGSSGGGTLPAARLSSDSPFHQGWTTNTMPNILSDAQRKRGSQQWGLGKQSRK